TSCSTHLCNWAIMSQVSVGGGEKATWGSLPTLMRRMGAGAPHSLPSRNGPSGTATTAKPLSRTAQRAWASSISWADQSASALALARAEDVASGVDAVGLWLAAPGAGAGGNPWADTARAANRSKPAAAIELMPRIETAPIAMFRPRSDAPRIGTRSMLTSI